MAAFQYRGAPGPNPVPVPVPDYMSEEKLQEKGKIFLDETISLFCRKKLL